MLRQIMRESTLRQTLHVRVTSDTQTIKSAYWPKLRCALCRYLIPHFFSDQTSCQMVRQTGCRYVNQEICSCSTGGFTLSLNLLGVLWLPCGEYWTTIAMVSCKGNLVIPTPISLVDFQMSCVKFEVPGIVNVTKRLTKLYFNIVSIIIYGELWFKSTTGNHGHKWICVRTAKKQK